MRSVSPPMSPTRQKCGRKLADGAEWHGQGLLTAVTFRTEPEWTSSCLNGFTRPHWWETTLLPRKPAALVRKSRKPRGGQQRPRRAAGFGGVPEAARRRRDSRTSGQSPVNERV